jgi:regulator of sigma D
MPHRNSDPQEQFNAVEELLTRWLKERRELLGKYTEIAVALDYRDRRGAGQRDQWCRPAAAAAVTV